MFESFVSKIYFLFLFFFVFILILQKYFEIEIFYVLISLYWVLLIPLKSFFTNHFNKLSWDFNFKNIILSGWIYVFFFCIVIWYFLAFNTMLFLLTTFYIFLVAFEINHKNLFFLSGVYFLWFLWFFLTHPDSYIYSSYLIFFLYSMIAWIFSLIVWEKFFSNISYIWNVVLIIFIFFLMGSFYFYDIIPYLPVITLLLLVCFKKKERIHYHPSIKADSMIFSLFFIWCIPIINDFLILEEKNIILLGTGLWFFLLYIWYNLILKKALC